MDTLFGSKKYRTILCTALALVGVVFFASGTFLSSLLQMDPVLCGMMSSQLVGIGFTTAALIMFRLSTGREDRKYVIEGFTLASLSSLIVILFNLQYANAVLDLAGVCAAGIFILCFYWFFKQADMAARQG